MTNTPTTTFGVATAIQARITFSTFSPPPVAAAAVRDAPQPAVEKAHLRLVQ